LASVIGKLASPGFHPGFKTSESIMVNYIGTTRVRELVAHVGVARFMEVLAADLAVDYRRFHEFDKSPRHASHSAMGVIELMPTSDGSQYSFKYVNGHPKNTAEGLLTVTAFGVLADVASGYPLLLSEMTFVTALRTAAISALAARHMARPDSRVMALIGNGSQSEFQAIAFHHLLKVGQLRLFDTDRRATDKLARNLEALRLPGLVLECCASAAQAAHGADIVTTVTADKKNALILTPGMIEPGMHLNAVGGDCPGKTELHPDIVRDPSVRIVVEFEPQARIEGEIQQLAAGAEVAELADVLNGRKPGRTNAREVTVFDSVGFALNDFTALRYLHRLNGEFGGGEQIDLIPVLDDPKDLYAGLTRPSTGARRAA
jgi:ornithine cyclodeaminase